MNLTLTNLHPSLRPPRINWRKTVQALVRLVLKESKRFRGFCLFDLNVVWMDDAQIAEANWRYLRHRGPTDILTFDYGEGVAEILISLDTARSQASLHGQTLEQELTLYLAHGILHLAGLHDHTPPQIRRMRREEQWLIEKLYETRR